jgi:hypothetical protein
MSFTPQFIKYEIARNSEKPSGKFGGRLIAGRRFPDPDEYLLRKILRFGVRTKHFAYRSNNPGFVGLNQEPEGLHVSLPDTSHPTDFRLGRFRFSHGGIYHSEGKTHRILYNPSQPQELLQK